MISIKQSFIKSNKVSLTFSILAVLLLVLLTGTIFVYSSNVQEFRVPNTRLSHKLISAINESTSLQKSWILLGEKSAKEQKQEIWSTRIPKLMTLIEQQLHSIEYTSYLGKNEELLQLKNTISKVTKLLVILKDSQWWIDEISSSKGASPSRVIYYREVLPLFDNLNGALEGLMYDKNYNSIESHELRISLIMAHHHLSDGLRELSEAIRTGALAQIDSFYRESEFLDLELRRFLEMAKNKGSSKPLLEWVITNYREYLRLARKSIISRQATDANLGLYLYQNEAMPIKEELNELLQNLIETEREFLTSGAEQINRAMLVFLFLVVVIFCIAFLINYKLSRKTTDQYIYGINSLISASHDMVKGRLRTIETKSNFREIQNLISAFSKMQNAVLDRETKLEDKQREIKQLTHLITHDMKPPIINIKGHADIISSKIEQTSWQKDSFETEIQSLRATVDESLVYINQSAAHIGDLVGRILTYAEWSTLVLNMVPCDLSLIIDDILAINSHRLKSSKVAINSDLPVINCDSFALKTIISTIVDNAIQYSSSSRTLVLVFAYQELDKFHRISIKDNGCGISLERSESIYLLSGKYSVDSLINQQNFGIGLAGTRKLITRAGGKIWHESNNSTTGTTFFLEFPSQVS